MLIREPKAVYEIHRIREEMDRREEGLSNEQKAARANEDAARIIRRYGIKVRTARKGSEAA